jgi:SAM-dependent methyltransferase
VTVVEQRFEDWAGEPGAFDVVASAQAWHWVDPAAGLAVAARALRPGGVLAVWWNRPADEGGPVLRAVEAAYRRVAPELADTHVMIRPRLETIDPTALGAAGFEPAQRRSFPWTASYDTAGYTELLRTHSDHRMLAPAALERLLAEVARVIEQAGGGRLDYRYRTQLLLARRR